MLLIHDAMKQRLCSWWHRVACRIYPIRYVHRFSGAEVTQTDPGITEKVPKHNTSWTLTRCIFLILFLCEAICNFSVPSGVIFRDARICDAILCPAQTSMYNIGIRFSARLPLWMVRRCIAWVSNFLTESCIAKLVASIYDGNSTAQRDGHV